MDYYAQRPAGIYKVEFSVLIFSIWLILRVFSTLNALSLSLSLCCFFPLCLLPSLSLSYFWTQLFYLSLRPPSRPSLSHLCLPANSPPSPPSPSFHFLLSRSFPLSLARHASPSSPSTHPPPLNHSPCNVNSNCLVWGGQYSSNNAEST